MSKGAAVFLCGLVVFTLLLSLPLSARSADNIIVGVSGPAINMVYAFVARDAGLWQKYGIDPRVVLFDAGSLMAQAMLSGDVKISISPGPAVIAARSQGADTIIVAACVNTLPYSIVAAKGITQSSQLKGKKRALGRPGSGTDTAILLALKKSCLDAAGEVPIVQLGTEPSRL